MHFLKTLDNYDLFLRTLYASKYGLTPAETIEKLLKDAVIYFKVNKHGKESFYVSKLSATNFVLLFLYGGHVNNSWYFRGFFRYNL